MHLSELDAERLAPPVIVWVALVGCMIYDLCIRRRPADPSYQELPR